MHSGSTELNTAIAGQSRTFAARITAGETVITSGIKSVKWIGGGNAGDSLTIGSTVAARVEVEMAAPGILLENKEITVEIGVQLESGVEYIPMGKYTVEKPEKSAGNIRFVAHDRMVSKGELAYFSGLSYPSDSLKVLDEICGKMGITLGTAGLKAITLQVKPEGYTCREALGYIAGLYGKFAVVNRTGQLELRWYEATGTVDFDRADEPEVAEYDFTVQKITCAVDKETTLTAGSGVTGIQCSNPLMTQDALDTAFEPLKGFSYRPGTLSLRLGDPRIDPWDMLQVTRDGETYLLPCMELIHDYDGGLTTEITAAGQSQTEAAYDYQGPTAQRIDRVYTELMLVRDLVADSVTVDYLQANYATIKDLTAVSAKVGSLEADVAKIGELTANMVTTEYLETHYAQIDLANIKEGCITTAMIGTGVIGTTQIADGSITDAKIVGLTANKITAGTLDAAEIDVINMNCANLTVGTINGQQIAPGAVNMDKLGQDASSAITGAASDAAQALEAAQEATTAAGAAQASADGKNTVYYQEGLPPPYGHKINDVCFDTSEDNCIFYWAGESWAQVQFGTNAIANASITNALIADATIQSAKIAFLDAGKITTGILSADRIAANSITAAKLAVGTITAAQIAVSTITGDKIAASTITAKNLAADCITSDKIVADAITTSKIAASAVTANEIAANAITAGKIAAGAISTDKLAAGAVTAGKINVTSLQAISANIGGFSIGGSYIAKGTTALAGAANSVYLGTNGISCGTAFKVTSAGALTCTNGSFTGTIKSSSATITGGSINITTSDQRESVITLKCGNYNTTMSPYIISMKQANDLVSELYFVNIGAFLKHSNGKIIGGFSADVTKGSGIVYLADSSGNQNIRLTGSDGSAEMNIVRTNIVKGKADNIQNAVNVVTSYALFVRNYANTDPQEVIASKFTVASSERYKSNISVYQEDALAVIRNAPIYTYNRNSDLEKGVSKQEIGFVIERGAPVSIINDTGDGIVEYSAIGILWKGMQQTDTRMKVMESREMQLEQRVEYLQQQLTRAYTLMAENGIKETIK